MKAKSKRTRSVILIVLGIVVSMGLISYQFKPSGNETTAEEEASKPTEQSAATTGTFTLKKENLDLLKVKGIDRKVALPISGRVIAKNETNIHAEVQGRVLDLGFKLREGVYFKAGD
ncbi:MAG: hypothetical protein KI790_00005, partial [Cyclobacteriaceae bacterium]|nr:hypothetical protein [Cyclobacteriaceae bacterium HetDA_MAG_MS6]